MLGAVARAGRAAGRAAAAGGGVVRGHTTDTSKVDLTKEQKGTVKCYIDNSHDKAPIRLQEMLSKVAELLTSKKLGVKTLYRGECFNSPCWHYLLWQKQKGKEAIIPLKDILSFTTNPEVAAMFARERKRQSNSDKRHPIQVELNLKNSEVYGLDISNINIEEAEVVAGGPQEQCIVIHPDEIGKDTAWTITIIQKDDLTDEQKKDMYVDRHTSKSEASPEAMLMYPFPPL